MRKSTNAQHVLLAAASCVFAVNSGAFENGAPPGNTGGFGETDCTACHFDNVVNAEGGGVAIRGVPAAFVAGQRYAFTIALEHSDLSAGGFQLAVRGVDGKSAGELYAHQDDVNTVSVAATSMTYIQHSKPRGKHDNDTDIRWTVVWKAPDDDSDVTINLAANAANGDASSFGDFICTASARVPSSASTPSPESSLQLEQEITSHEKSDNQDSIDLEVPVAGRDCNKRMRKGAGGHRCPRE